MQTEILNFYVVFSCCMQIIGSNFDWSDCYIVINTGSINIYIWEQVHSHRWIKTGFQPPNHNHSLLWSYGWKRDSPQWNIATPQWIIAGIHVPAMKHCNPAMNHCGYTSPRNVSLQGVSFYSLDPFTPPFTYYMPCRVY